MTVDPIGGVWTYALDLCRALDHEVALASMGRRLTAGERADVKALPRVQLFESEFKLEWMSDPWDDVTAAGEWLMHLADRIKPGLVHLNQFAHGALPWKVPCLVVGHSCVLSWFEVVRSSQSGNEWREYQRSVARGLRGADRVTAPSRWMSAQLKKHYGRFAESDAIYNGSSARRFAPGLKEDFIFTAGRLWDEAKNVRALAPVAAKLPWPIYAAGDMSGPDGVCADLNGLRVLGHLDSEALAHWLGRAQIFVLPALYEPFGLSVLEAALAGCVLVLGDIPSLREIWQNAAVFVSPRDSGAISAALAALIAEPPLRWRLARAARSRALTFTADRMARSYRAVYAEMLAAAANRQPGPRTALRIAG
jgi:glycogen synthase